MRVRSPVAAARALAAPWRRPPCGAPVLGPQVESLDQRVRLLEGECAALATALAEVRIEVLVEIERMTGLPATLGASLQMVTARLELVETALAGLSTQSVPGTVPGSLDR